MKKLKSWDGGAPVGWVGRGSQARRAFAWSIIGWSLAVGAGGALLLDCAAWNEGLPANTAAGKTARDRPNDGDVESLVPAGVQTVIHVDMAQLRRSPWLTPALEVRDRHTRALKEDALGYDDVNDVDRVIYAVTPAGADAPTLVIAQGRFQMPRIEESFRARWPGAVVDRWRGIAVLSQGENAIALLTARTFVSGAPPMVRTVIDRAFGIGGDLGSDPALGPIRRALSPEGAAANPAVLAIVAVDDRIRARIGDSAPVPRELRQIGARVDLGRSLELRGLGILDDREAAAALARRLNALLTEPTTRLALRAMGLAMLLTDMRVTAEGARVLTRLSIAEEHRPQLSTMLKMVVESQRPRAGGLGTGAPPFGSW